MQIRCYNCHTPFDVNREEIHAALDEIQRDNLKYYNAHCPRCRKANKLSKAQLRQWAPTWTPPKKKGKPKTTKTETEAKEGG